MTLIKYISFIILEQQYLMSHTVLISCRPKWMCVFCVMTDNHMRQKNHPHSQI